MKKIEIYKVEGDKISRQRRICPKCGDGVYLADHKDRQSCGKCGYTEFKSGGKKQQAKSVDKPQEIKQEIKKDVKEEKKPEQKQELSLIHI